jgi:hypothetical protein
MQGVGRRVGMIVVMLAAAGLLAPAADATPSPVWTAARQLGLPANVASNSSSGLDSVSCTSPGNCTAVGHYSDTSGDREAMTVAETGGAWAAPKEFALLPAGAPATGHQTATLLSISCTSPGSCTASGYYEDMSGSEEAMTATEAGGVWARAKALALPSDANTTAGLQDALLDSVSCTSPGNCTAVGSYADDNGPYDYQAMIAVETAGSWATAKKLTLPAGAATASDAQGAGLDSVSCNSPGNCSSTGYFKKADGNSPPMTARETAGTWAQATQLTLPDNADISPGWGGELRAVSCTSPGNCTAVGQYTDASDSTQAMTAAETNNSWAVGREVSLPAGATTVAGAQDALLEAVSCASPGNCSTGGFYTTTSPNDYETITVTQAAGIWAQAKHLALPAAATASDQSSGLDGISCATPGACAGVGSFRGTNNYFAPMVVNSVPSLGISAAPLPLAGVRASYHEQLSASGGTGHHRWSIRSGSLPAGLHLSSVTGAITGVPTKAGSFRFTVTLTDSGPPGQAATATFSITVKAPRRFRANFGNRRITLTTPSACIATGGKLELTLASAKRPHSRGHGIKFSYGAIYIGKGVRHVHHSHHHRVVTYGPNATVRHLPAAPMLALSALHAGTYQLEVKLFYSGQRHKTLKTSFAVC